VTAGLFAGFGPGRRVAGYLLEDQLGAGGMAVVFRATDERLGRKVALKIMAPGAGGWSGLWAVRTRTPC
jgi:hypothetical protein